MPDPIITCPLCGGEMHWVQYTKAAGYWKCMRCGVRKEQ